MKRSWILISLLMFTNVLFAQKKPDEIPLLKYLQANFDSSVIMHVYSTWGYEPNYSIICKTGNGLAYFTYKNPFANFSARAYPDELSKKFFKLSWAYKSIIPDTNRYFLPISNRFTYQNDLWQTIQKNNCWHIKDSRETEQLGSCRFDISDGSEYSFYLITKQDIKELYFYEPFYFEEHCPGNNGRKQIINIINSFRKMFK
jgi:hypothetical protein